MLRKTISLPQVPIFWDDVQLPRFSSFRPLLIQILLSVLAGSVLNALHLPVAWLLGAIGVGIVYALTQSQTKPLPNSLSTVGQGVIAIATATRFSPDALTVAHHYLFPLMICIAVTGGMSLLNGYLLYKFAGIDKTTGFLGSIPGAGPSIVAMSEEMGADAIAVAVLQYMRIFMVALLIPLLMGFLYANNGDQDSLILVTASQSNLLPLGLNLTILGVCIGVGVWGGKQLKLPSALFLGPFLMGLTAFWLLPNPIYVPKPLFLGGLLLLGLSIGLKFNVKTMQKLFKAVIVEGILVLCLILACLGAGYTFHLMTGVDAMTAILGSTPGGISAMMATVIHLGGDAGLVMAMQMTRMLLILLLSPLFASTLNQNNVYVSKKKS